MYTFDEIEIIDVEKQKENFNEWNLKYKNTILHTCEKQMRSRQRWKDRTHTSS